MADGVAPDELAQLFVAQHLFRVPDERRKQPVFETRQGDLAVVVAHGALREGDAEPGVGVRVLRSAAAWTAQEHVDPCHELLTSERLDHVVVRSALEAADAFELRVARGQHQDGDVRHLPDPLERLPAVETRHRNVEDDQVGRAGVELAQAFAPVRSVGDLVSRPLQQRAQEPTNVVVVVDDEDPGTGHHDTFHRAVQDSCALADLQQ